MTAAVIPARSLRRMPVASPRTSPDARLRPQPGVRSAPTHLALTARGRAVLALLIAALVVAAWAGTGGGWPFTSGTPQVVHAITVAPGQTMWSIATEIVGPTADVRPIIRQIEQINHLDSTTLLAGQRLLVPVE